MKISTLLILMLVAVTILGQKIETKKSRQNSITWKINNLKKISGNPETVMGEPKIIETDKSKEILFDGIDNGIIIKSNLIEIASEFTIEAVSRPNAGSSKEQRWLHIVTRLTRKAALFLKTENWSSPEI